MSREIVEIPVERIDPAEALRRIRAEVKAFPITLMHRYEVVQIIDRHWPNGAQP